MQNQIINFFNNIDQIVPDTINHEKQIYCVDNFLPSDVYENCIKDIKKIDNWELCDDEITTRSETNKLYQSSLLQTLLLLFNSNYMCEWLNKHTNSQGLIPDPYFHGAGLCRTEQGAKLSLHCDFNWAKHIKLNRNVNAILYLTKDWQKQWNGDLQFWKHDRSKCIEKLFPLPNRLIFWKYNKDLWHGMPELLTNPKDNPRDQICIWYYTSNDKPKNNPQTSRSKT